MTGPALHAGWPFRYYLSGLDSTLQQCNVVNFIADCRLLCAEFYQSKCVGETEYLVLVVYFFREKSANQHRRYR